MCLFVEIVEACARPERMICAYSESAGIHGEGDCVCGIGLKLHGIYARICGRANEVQEPLAIAVMVSRYLSDDDRWCGRISNPIR